MVLEGVSINKLRRTFKVISVNSHGDNLARFQLTSTTICILRPDEEGAALDELSGGDLIVTGVPGLSAQINVLNKFLRGFSRPFWVENERESCGLVIHGGHGTGKTFILQRIADTKWGRPFWIKPSDKLSTIRETFRQAQAQQPSMVFLDGLEDLIGKDRANRDSVIETIGEELDSLSVEASINNALPHVVVIATCSDYMLDVPTKLQKISRLDKNIALPIPRATERLEILQFYNPPLRADEKEDILLNVSQKTHAYNGYDLKRLVSNARMILGDRLDESGVEQQEAQKHFLTMEDVEQALRITRPTAMHDINLKPPTIHWQDVGGQEGLKKVLSRMIKNTKVKHAPLPPWMMHPPY